MSTRSVVVEPINPTTIAVKNGTVSSSITIRASLRMLKLEILTRVDHHLSIELYLAAVRMLISLSALAWS